MGVMTLANFRTEVLLTLGNMSTSDPLYTNGIVDRAINRAPNRIRRIAEAMGVTMPEKINTWTLGPTVVGENRIALPDDCLIVEDVRSADSSTDPDDWAETEEKVVSRSTALTIGLLSKESTDTGYPKLWDRKANSIIYHPTTRTGYTTYFRIYGLAREETISSAGSTFNLHEDWDGAICKFAAAEIALIRGWTERSKELEEEGKELIAETAKLSNRGTAPGVVESELMPSRSDVYGGA